MNSYINISKSAINHNIAFYRNRIKKQDILAAVIKGNGYGHGLIEMGMLCQENDHINWICVAHLSEALSLRKHNIHKPILVFGYADTNIEHAVNLDITFMVDNIDYVRKLNEIGAHNKCIFTVHIKVDTGLSRLGISPEETLPFIRALQMLPHIIINGIYSHFAASDTNPEYTSHQLSQFINLITLLSHNNIMLPNIHMSNSAALKKIDYSPIFNFFRLGIGLYGFSPFELQLKPALTWKTYIASIKTVPAYSYISYALEYQATRLTRIAILPVGYSDGYDMRLSNKMSVRIHESYAPILGRIAMNMIIVDITTIDASVGDEVILLGDYPDITIYDFAQKGAIKNPREILTGINPHIQRIIVE